MMTHKASPSLAYTQRSLELRAAEYYVGIRKPESQWKSIDDLWSQLKEFDHRIQGENYEGAYFIVESIDSDYLYRWGYYSLLLWLRLKLSKGLSADLKGNNYGALGKVCHELGQFTRALRYHKAALVIARQTNNRACEGIWLGHIGGDFRALGQAERAIAFYRRALDIAKEIGEQKQIGLLIGIIGIVYLDLDELESAISHFRRALTISYRVNDRRREQIWLSYLGKSYYRLRKFEQALNYYADALSIANEIQYNIGKSYCLIGLGRIYLSAGDSEKVEQYLREAQSTNIVATSYEGGLALGISLLSKSNSSANDIFANVIAECQVLLRKTENSYAPRYVLATALVAQAICDPHWADPTQRPILLAPALTEYRRALDITATPGVVCDALRDLELIRAAGIEGLEPAFALLEQAIADWHPLSDDALPSPASSQEDTL